MPATYGFGGYGEGLYGLDVPDSYGTGSYDDSYDASGMPLPGGGGSGLAGWSSLETTWDSLVDYWGEKPPPRSKQPTSLSIGVWAPVSGSTWQKVHEIRTWTTVAIEPRYLDPGTWSLTMPYNTQAASLSKGQLLTFDLVRDEGTQRLMTGVPTTLGPGADETGGVFFEASGMGALGLLGDVLCWPQPAQDLDAQTATHYTATGPTETVLRNLIAANMITRRDDPLTIAASAGRGKTITLKEPMGASLFEVVVTRCRQANLGVRMDLVRSTSSTRAVLKLEFFTPSNVSQRVRLSHRVGSLRTWKQSDTAPTGTRALCAAVMGQTPMGVEVVSVATDTLTTTTNAHTFQTGAKLKITGVPIAPLSASTDYYAIRVDADTLAVAASRSKALKGTKIKLTTAGLRIEKVNVVPNAITITKGDIPETGARIRLQSPTGSVPSPLSTGTVYYAIKVDRDTVKVATTLANANAGTAINLTDDGTGAMYVYEAGATQVVEIARTYRQAFAGSGVESEWNRKIEVFVDASGEDLDDIPELLEKGEIALKEMTAQSGFELEAVESEGVRYGTHFDLGDTIAIELLTGLSTTDQLSAVQIEGGSGGINVKLIPGSAVAGKPSLQLGALIARLRRELKALQREED